MDIKTRPQQQTEYVVRAGAYEESRIIYEGDSPTEARNVARATPNATVTFRSETGVRLYL